MADHKDVSVSVSDMWGIACLRQAAGFPVGAQNKFHYVCPLGPSVVIWDIEKKKKTLSKQMADDLITILIKSETSGLILLVSYSGEGKLLDHSLNTLCSFEIPGNNVIYASWSRDGNLFTVCTIGRQSSISLFEVSADKRKVTLKWSVKASSLSGELSREQGGSLGTSEMGIKNGSQQDSGASTDVSDGPQRTYQSYYGSIFTEESTIIAIFNKEKKPCEAHLYDFDGKLLQIQVISPLGENNTGMLCMSDCKDGKFAIGLQRGIFVFVQSSNLEILSLFQSQGSAQVCLWDKDLLLTVAYQSGVLQWWNVSAEIVKETKVENLESVVHLNWSMPGKELWIGGITSLNYVIIEPERSAAQKEIHAPRLLSLSEHKIAGCGLSFKDNSTVATGDLAGNVFVNKMGQEFSFDDNQDKVNVKSSVRCLAWVQDVLFVGTLEGTLFKWVPVTSNSEAHNLELVYTFPFGVLSIRKSNFNNLLAVGTGGGDLYIFDTEKNFDLILEKKVHLPQAVSAGLEKHFMEIWSIAWEPSDELIATASEDRTSIVSNAKTGDLVVTIKGHTTAVTSIDWKILSNNKCILATCADDRTVRIYDGKTFELLNVLQTDNIHGWYTLTYLAINTSKDWLLCSTQNGFLVLWDLNTMKCMFCKKLHCGSIEGLEWSHSQENFGTIGSDCIANVFSISSCEGGIEEKKESPML